MNGFVSLVGAGPGDPELLTVKAARRLEEAEVIFHDALVSAEVLALAHRAWRISVGKRAGTKEVTQEDIHRLLVRTARRGRRVVRLKCGDPFVLGRGGEEALALAEAGVPFEVVPGVSSALAAPALAGVPVTHRGLASGFLVVSGHAEATWRPILDALPPSSVTVVVLMGVPARAQIAAALLARGWPAATPAAALANAPALPRTGAPGCLCIGRVVGIAATLARLKGRAGRNRGAASEPEALRCWVPPSARGDLG